MRRRCHLVALRFHHLLAEFPSAKPGSGSALVACVFRETINTHVRLFELSVLAVAKQLIVMSLPGAIPSRCATLSEALRSPVELHW